MRQGFFAVPVQTPTQANLFTVIKKKMPNFSPLFDAHGDRADLFSC